MSPACQWLHQKWWKFMLYTVRKIWCKSSTLTGRTRNFWKVGQLPGDLCNANQIQTVWLVARNPQAFRDNQPHCTEMRCRHMLHNTLEVSGGRAVFGTDCLNTGRINRPNRNIFSRMMTPLQIDEEKKDAAKLRELAVFSPPPLFHSKVSLNEKFTFPAISTNNTPLACKWTPWNKKTKWNKTRPVYYFNRFTKVWIPPLNFKSSAVLKMCTPPGRTMPHVQPTFSYTFPSVELSWFCPTSATGWNLRGIIRKWIQGLGET